MRQSRFGCPPWMRDHDRATWGHGWCSGIAWYGGSGGRCKDAVGKVMAVMFVTVVEKVLLLLVGSVMDFGEWMKCVDCVAIALNWTNSSLYPRMAGIALLGSV